jgi:copper chaperone
MITKTFKVPTISCQHCVNTIRMELSEMQGIEQVKPDAELKSVEVVFQDPATEDLIINLLNEINYPVEQ